MKRFADLAGFLWLTLIFAGLAAWVGGCPHTRYIWAAQFVALWATIIGAIGVYNSGALKGSKS